MDSKSCFSLVQFKELLMARIRTIKPEFFTSESIVSLSPLARLLFIALWCEADRRGRLAWKPKTFKLRYFPADDCDIGALCKELVDSELVIIYENNQKLYADIPSFEKHQVINNRESESLIQARVNDASRTRHSGGCRGREGKGREGKEKEKEDASASQDSPRQVSTDESPRNMSTENFVWREGVSLLTSKGCDERSARVFLGRMCKERGPPAVMQAIEKAIDEDAVEPRAYIAGVLANSASVDDPVERMMRGAVN